MSCADHTVHLEVDGHDLKLDTRHVRVTVDGTELRRDAGLAELLTRRRAAGPSSAGLTLTVEPRRGHGAPVVLHGTPDGCWRASRARDVHELFAAATFDDPARWTREPLFASVAAELAAELAEALTDAEATTLLAAGIGPGRLRSYLEAGAATAAQVRRLHCSNVSPEQLAAWRTLDPTISVGSVLARAKVRLTPERVLAFADVLLEQPTPEAPLADRALALAAAAGSARAGQLPLTLLWEGDSPLAGFLHQLGVTPRMLERAIVAERSVEGRGSYFSKLARAVQGDPSVRLQLLDYTLVPYRSGPRDDVQLRMNDRGLLHRTRELCRRDVPLAVAFDRAIRDAAQGTTPLVTTGSALAAGIAATAFSNGYTTAAGLWADQVRAGHGRVGSRDLRWQDVKDRTHAILRQRACPQVARDFGREWTGQLAFIAEGVPDASRSAAETQALRHVYLLHPEAACTALCSQLRSGIVPTVAVAGRYAELFHPYRAAEGKPQTCPTHGVQLSATGSCMFGCGE